MAVLRFGVFDLDLETGELHRAGRRVHITAQASKVLALLASRPGTVVSRDELKRHLWGDDTFVDFDRSLNFCVSVVRTALRDAAHSPRFIETLPRRGYRFIAETVLVEDAVPAPAPETVTPVDRSVLLKRGRWLLGAAAALMLVVQQPLVPAVHSRTTALPEARAAFARAFDAAPEDAAALRRSVAALKRATEIDPRFAEAHFALADLYLKLAIKHELPIASALAEAEAAARRAIALEDMPETRQVLANARLLGAWDWAGARRELARAVTLAPKWDIGLATYARVLSALGDDAAAITAIDRAETVSPTCDLILYDAGAIYARAGRFAEAEDKLRHAVARGDWNTAHQAAIAILEANGQPEDVRDRFMRAEPRTAVEAFLRRSAENTTAAAASRYVPPTRLATIFALLDDRDRAIDQLEAAAADRDPDLIYAFRDPEFEHLRGLARFQSLERRIRGSREPRTSTGNGTN